MFSDYLIPCNREGCVLLLAKNDRFSIALGPVNNDKNNTTLNDAEKDTHSPRVRPKSET